MFFNNLLIAVDDSAPSQYAIEVGLIIAQRDKCPVVFCVVLDPAITPQNYGLDSICELAEGRANDLLQAAMQRATTAGVEASAKTIYHDVCQGIIDTANAQKAGMIVMGTHGRTGIARAMLSSVAESVLRRTTTPLCVIRRPPIYKIYGRFLVPITGDDLCKPAIDFAIEGARSFASTLLFCTVMNGSDKKGAEDMLESASRVATEGGIKSECVVLESRESIPDAILQQTGILENDAIVMATHARDGFMRFVQGSVTEAVIRSSLIPVVVIR
jgi:nucleotide-binding universal stress UspA family protein